MERSCHLQFQGTPDFFKEVSVGTPQGSPISPLLFVLYVAPLHRSDARANTISFMDNLALTSVSTSHRRNVRLLQARFRTLTHRASKLGLSFSVPKTELIHWRTLKERSRPRVPRYTLRVMSLLPRRRLGSSDTGSRPTPPRPPTLDDVSPWQTLCLRLLKSSPSLWSD